MTDKELSENIVKNLERLCLEKKGLKTTPACIEAGVGNSFVSDIKRGRLPSIAKFVKIAQYLGCQVSEIIGDKDDQNMIRQKQLESFVSFLSGLSQEQRVVLGKFMEEKKNE